MGSALGGFRSKGCLQSTTKLRVRRRLGFGRLKRHLNNTSRLLFLLISRSAMCLNAQEERLATPPFLVTRLSQPHAIVVMVHVRKTNVVIIKLGNAGHSWCLTSNLSLSVGFAIQDKNHACYPICATGGSLPRSCIYLLP